MNITPTDENERWMGRCLELARCGQLGAPPNPMVGAVLVHEGRIIGEGYHIRCGEPHAEVNCLRSVLPANRHLISKSTLYVSLEPCAHYGRTPPCAELIIRHAIPRVVVGCVDPFARVQGKGISMLREAGIEVTVGVLRNECLHLNRHFICQHAMGRPFITLKWAASADGFIDGIRSLRPDGTVSEAPAHISTARTLLHVHRLRATHGAILVGHRTLLMDRPRLDVRHWPGASPMRCVIGKVGEEALQMGFEAYADIDSLLNSLRRQGIPSLLVEGGAHTLQAFIERDLWDEAWEEAGSVVLGQGVEAPHMPKCFQPAEEVHFGGRFRHWESPVLKKLYVDF